MNDSGERDASATDRDPTAPAALDLRTERVRSVVSGWLRALRRRGGWSSVVLLEPRTPEARLLAAWFDSDQVPWRPGADRAFPEAMAEVRASDPDALAVAGWHRSRLLLDGNPGVALPLGDLWGFEVAELAGGCSLPHAIADVGWLRRVEEALARGLASGHLRAELTAALGAAEAEGVEARLRRHAPGLRGPILPKLGNWTPGMDPHLS